MYMIWDPREPPFGDWQPSMEPLLFTQSPIQLPVTLDVSLSY